MQKCVTSCFRCPNKSKKPNVFTAHLIVFYVDFRPEDMAPHVMTVLEKAPSGTMWILEGGEPPYQFRLPNRFTEAKEFLK